MPHTAFSTTLRQRMVALQNILTKDEKSRARNKTRIECLRIVFDALCNGSGTENHDPQVVSDIVTCIAFDSDCALLMHKTQFALSWAAASAMVTVRKRKRRPETDNAPPPRRRQRRQRPSANVLVSSDE